MNQKLLIVVLILIVACKPPVTTEEITTIDTKYNTSINTEIKAEIKAINDQLIPFIVNNNSAEISKLSSDLLLNNNPTGFSEVITLASGLIQKPTYSILAEYHTLSTESDLEIKIDHTLRTEKDTNDFILNYTSPNRESYVNLLLVDAGHGERMVSVIYSKYATKWKIDYLHFSNYSLYGQTAPEYYYASEFAYKNKTVLEAFTLALLSKTCSQPGGEIFAFDIETEMQGFYEKIFSEVEATYVFPINADQIPTKPSISGISLIPLANYQYIPSVSYVSQINLADEEAIHVECDQINEDLAQILPGFTWQFNQVLFRVFDQNPKMNEEAMSLNLLKPVHFTIP